MDAEQRANVRANMATGVRILCGEEANWYAHNGGV